MCQNFGGLFLSQPVVPGTIQMTSDLRDLTGSDQRANGDQAAVARRKRSSSKGPIRTRTSRPSGSPRLSAS
jgi:hypothetical protein